MRRVLMGIILTETASARQQQRAATMTFDPLALPPLLTTDLPGNSGRNQLPV